MASAKRASSAERRGSVGGVKKKLSKFFGADSSAFDSFHDTSVKLIETGAFGLNPAQWFSFWGSLDNPDEVSSFLERCIKKLVEIEESPSKMRKHFSKRGVELEKYVQFVLSTMYFIVNFCVPRNTTRLRNTLAYYDGFRREHPVHNSPVDRVVQNLRRRHLSRAPTDEGKDGAQDAANPYSKKNYVPSGSSRSKESSAARADHQILSSLVELSTLDPPPAVVTAGVVASTTGDATASGAHPSAAMAASPLMLPPLASAGARPRSRSASLLALIGVGGGADSRRRSSAAANPAAAAAAAAAATAAAQANGAGGGGGSFVASGFGGAANDVLGAQLSARLDLTNAPFAMLRMMELADYEGAGVVPQPGGGFGSREAAAEMFEHSLALLEKTPAQLRSAPVQAIITAALRRALSLLRLLRQLLAFCALRPPHSDAVLARALRATRPFFGCARPVCVEARITADVIEFERRAPGHALRMAVASETGCIGINESSRTTSMPVEGESDGKDTTLSTVGEDDDELEEGVVAAAATVAQMQQDSDRQLDSTQQHSVKGGVLTVFVDMSAPHSECVRSRLRTRKNLQSDGAGVGIGTSGASAELDADANAAADAVLGGMARSSIKRRSSLRASGKSLSGRGGRGSTRSSLVEQQALIEQRERQRIYRRQQQRDAITQLLLMTAEARSRHIDSASLDARGEQELRQAATQVTAAARQMVLGADTESRQRATEHLDTILERIQRESEVAAAEHAEDSILARARQAQETTSVEAESQDEQKAHDKRTVTADHFMRRRPRCPPLLFDVESLVDLRSQRSAGRVTLQAKTKRISARLRSALSGDSGDGGNPTPDPVRRSSTGKRLQRRQSTEPQAIATARSIAAALTGGEPLVGSGEHERHNWDVKGDGNYLHYEEDLFKLAAAANAADADDAKSGKSFKLALIGGNQALHQLVCAYVVLRKLSPSLLARVAPQLYVVPTGSSDIAAHLCKTDGWYMRHLAVPWAKPLMLVPRMLHQAEVSESMPGMLESTKGWGVQTAAPLVRIDSGVVLPRGSTGGGALESPLHLVDGEGGEIDVPAPRLLPVDPHEKLCDLLQAYARHASTPVNMCIYKCECWERPPAAHSGRGFGGATEREADITIPFCLSVELGLLAEAKALQRRRPKEDLEDTLCSKAFHRLAPEWTATQQEMGVDSSASKKRRASGSAPELEAAGVSGATVPLIVSYTAVSAEEAAVWHGESAAAEADGVVAQQADAEHHAAEVAEAAAEAAMAIPTAMSDTTTAHRRLDSDGGTFVYDPSVVEAAGRHGLDREIASSPYAALVLRAVQPDPSSVSYGSRACRAPGAASDDSAMCAIASEEINPEEPWLQLKPHPIRATKGAGGALAESMRKSHKKSREAQSLLHNFCMAEGCGAARLPPGPGVRGNGVAADVSHTEVRCTAPGARFHMLIDGELHGPYHRIRVSPLYNDEDNAASGVVRLPVMSFMSPVEHREE